MKDNKDSFSVTLIGPPGRDLSIFAETLGHILRQYGAVIQLEDSTRNKNSGRIYAGYAELYPVLSNRDVSIAVLSEPPARGLETAHDISDGYEVLPMHGEPVFELLARDDQFASLVETWASAREADIRCGMRPPDDTRRVVAARIIAAKGAEWRRRNNGAWRDMTDERQHPTLWDKYHTVAEPKPETEEYVSEPEPEDDQQSTLVNVPDEEGTYTKG